MGQLSKAIENSPALKSALDKNPEALAMLTELERLGAYGCCEKYLKDADEKIWEIFFSELAKLDFAHFERHRKELEKSKTAEQADSDFEPLRADKDQYEFESDDYKSGRKSLEAGEWGVLIFAGGSGTRFFSEWGDIPKAIISPSERWLESTPDKTDPKGMFPISPVMGLSFFERILAETFETGISCGRLPVVLFMTSSVTHERTKKFIEENEFWGFPKQCLRIFKQGEVARIDEDGDLIVKEDGSLFWTGNGHGGVYDALERICEDNESSKAWAERLGIKHVIMGNVDNAALKPLYPARLGYHIRKQSQYTITVVKRTDPTEKVGMTARRKDNGKVAVIEYSVLDPELSAKDDGKGGLLFDGAHINTNLLDLSASRPDLPGVLYTNKPVSVGSKKIMSSTLEMLNQDLPGMLAPDAVNSFETLREEYFLPTKSVLGRDSVNSTFLALIEASNRLLSELGADVAETADKTDMVTTELHPALGLSTDDYRKHAIGKGWKLGRGARVYLCVRLTESGDPISFRNLRLDEKASLVLKTQYPYGKVEFDITNRSIRESVNTASRINFGNDVKIAAGVKVNITINGNGVLTIPEGYCFTKDYTVTVNDEEKVVVG